MKRQCAAPNLKVMMEQLVIASTRITFELILEKLVRLARRLSIRPI